MLLIKEILVKVIFSIIVHLYIFGSSFRSLGSLVYNSMIFGQTTLYVHGSVLSSINTEINGISSLML